MTKSNHSADKIEGALELLTEAAQEKKSEIQDLLTNKYSDLRETLQATESSVVDAAGDLAAGAQKKARKVAARIDGKVHSDPWNVVGWSTVAALFVGYLIGRKE